MQVENQVFRTASGRKVIKLSRERLSLLEKSLRTFKETILRDWPVERPIVMVEPFVVDYKRTQKSIRHDITI